MPDIPHRVLGFYAALVDAQAVRLNLLAQGMPSAAIELLMPGARGVRQEARADSDSVRDEVLRAGAIGTAVGTLAGAAGTAVLAVVGVSLFLAAPVVGALAMLGWGAGVGGLVGAIAGAERSRGDVSDLIQDALAGGHVVLAVQAANPAQARLAERLIGASVQAADLAAAIDPAPARHRPTLWASSDSAAHDRPLSGAGPAAHAEPDAAAPAGT